MQLCRSIPMMNAFLKMWHYILRQLTSLSLWPSPPMSINEYLWIVDEAWWNVWGGGEGGGGSNLMMGWHLIQEVVAIPLVTSCRGNWNKLWLNCPSWLKYRLHLLLPERTVVSDKTHALTSWGMVLVYCFGMCTFLTTQDWGTM